VKQIKQKRSKKRENIYPSNTPPPSSIQFPSLRSILCSGNKKIAAMGRFGGALDLPAHREDDEDLFETSSSISGDSDDEGVEAPQEQINQFGLQVAPKTVRRLNSDSAYNMSSMKAELPAK
jgi:hypothetical protein